MVTVLLSLPFLKIFGLGLAVGYASAVLGWRLERGRRSAERSDDHPHTG